MSKKQFKSTRAAAIRWCREWRDYCIIESSEYETSGNDTTAQIALAHALEADKVADWLQTANRQDFEWWINRYQTQGIAYISEQQMSLFAA